MNENYTEELKQLIEHAETHLTGKAKIIMLAPTGEYDGFWGGIMVIKT